MRPKIELAVGPFAAAFTALVDHPRIAELWPAYLIMQHAIIRATVPLTEAAMERALALRNDDPLAIGLADYLQTHIDEERDHDAGLLDDLEVLGVDRAAVLDQMPSLRSQASSGASTTGSSTTTPWPFLDTSE